MSAIRFTLDGVVHTLTTEQVSALAGSEEPQPIQKLAVRLGDQWYPVKQAFGRAIGLANNQFNSRRAFDLLGRLGFQLHDVDVDGPLTAEIGTGGGNGVASAFDRTEVLRLAVQLYAGRPNVDAATVLATAVEFGRWIGEDAA